MRIALLMKRYSLKRGGGEYDLVRLSSSLLKRGHEVHLFVHDIEGETDPKLVFHKVPMNRAWAPLKILSFARNAPRVVEESGLDFDVIHAMTQTFPSDLYWNGGGLQINWLRERYSPGVLSRAWMNPRHAANLWVEKNLFVPGHYRHIVSLTSMEKGQILGDYKVPADRFHVIPNGIDPERFNPETRQKYRTDSRRKLGVSDDQKLLLVVGSDGCRKGFPQLFQALGKLPSTLNWRLAIAGNDPPQRWLPSVKRESLDGKVHFLAHEKHIERLYAAADLVIMASLFEGYGNVIPEAMACGCPVLTTRQVGAADFITPGVDGWILSSCKNIPEYTSALEEILSLQDLDPFGWKAVQKVKPFTWDWTVDRLEEVYHLIRKEKSTGITA